MALSTYATLKTSITNWSHRSDLTDLLDDFIDIVESRLSRELRVSQQETRATTTASTEYIALPADLIAIRNIQVNTSPVRELIYVSPAEMDRMDDNGSTVSRYTIIGDEIQLNATSSDSIEIAYWAKVPALSDSNTTNWLLEDYPDVYLYGCLAEAFKYASDDTGAAKYNALYQDALMQLQSADKKRKYGQSMFVRSA